MKKYTLIALKACTAVYLAVSLVLTFTVSDYYIFNRIGEFNVFFVLSQWVKKAGLLLLPLAVFYNKKSCSDLVKYILPVFTVISLFTFGGFFDVSMFTGGADPVKDCFASINEFMPKAANIALFIIASVLSLISCALLFVRDGFKVEARSFNYLPFAMFATIPLNFFENFFDISNFSREHFLCFKNFTVWHFLALAILAGATVGGYYFLRKKDKKSQEDWLATIAIVLLIQYHSKDSMLLGDGYNVYKYVFSAIPLFICNIGVYVASISVILKKRVLYAISFFVHAAGALTVFFYFGKDEMSNYGIIFSYSILYFCLTHCLLFALSVLPSALGHYKFTPRDCIIPLIYYCLVIVVATIASGLVTSFLDGYTYNGYSLSLEKGDFNYPNFAFTQVNPLPIPFNYIPFNIAGCTFYLSYLIVLYLVYVGLFWIFTGGYYAFLAIRKKVIKPAAVPAPVPAEAVAEAAVTDETNKE
ncbi:MAG: YwaF family protein [Muribaculaceae bacterium]|nr:YwaF family protein [Muribaculaceae bacterium]